MEALIIVGVIAICLILIAWFIKQISRWTVIGIVAGIIIVVLAIKTPT